MIDIDRELLKCEMIEFYDKDSCFRDYCHMVMNTYDKTLSQVLSSPITEEYYRSLIPGGCNYREVQNDKRRSNL